MAVRRDLATARLKFEPPLWEKKQSRIGYQMQTEKKEKGKKTNEITSIVDQGRGVCERDRKRYSKIKAIVDLWIMIERLRSVINKIQIT
jgi:hypothetical protein